MAQTKKGGGEWWRALRAWLWFVLSVAVLIRILIWARPFTDTRLTAWLASGSALLLRAAGVEAQTHATTLVTSLGTVEIVRECTGVYPTALYVAAVLAFPTGFARKLVGIGLGILAIQVVNLVRIISLILVQRWWPGVFETAHLVVWQSLMVFLIAVFWILWAMAFARGARRDAA
jgi:exosortase/archaeosortase family protein